MYKSPLFPQNVYISPLLYFNLRVFPLLTLFSSPYFDHDAVMHHGQNTGRPWTEHKWRRV